MPNYPGGPGYRRSLMKFKISKKNVWGILIALILTIGSVTMLAGNQTAAEQRSSLLQNSDSAFASLLKLRSLPFFLNTFDPKDPLTALADEATVRTNQSNYHPGETAKITGEDFGANETVTLQVVHSDGTPPGGGGHDPWNVTTDANGSFLTTWYVDPDDSANSAFLLTAISSTGSASATFTDAANAAADLDQCRNGSAASPSNCIGDGSGGTGWVNGNVGQTQGHYVEGYSIPYRMRMTGVTAGSWTLDIGYDTVHSSRHAIDFLTQYNRIDDPSHALIFGHTRECIDPSDSFIGGAGNVNNCPPEPGVAPSSTFAIPKPVLPNSVAGNPPGTPPCTVPYPGSDVLAGATSCPGTEFDRISGAVPAGTNNAFMTMWDGTITDIQYVSGQQNVVSGQGQQHTMIRIYFTVSAAQAAADGGNVNLAWGGHIGRALDWGTGNSAGGISGSPYHMNLHGFCSGATPNDGTLCTDGGSQDRSLSAQAVSAPGTIQIIKNIQQPGIDGTFGYTTTGDGLSNFNLITVSGTAQTTFTGLAAGARTVTESTIPSTHDFVSLVCTDPDNGTTVSGQTANIDLDAGETVVCTYTNKEDFNQTRGRIIVVKDTIPNDSQLFTFTSGGYTSVVEGNPFHLSDGQSNDSCGVGNDNCLVANVYSVAETPNSAYATTSSCSDGSPVTAIDVAEGETVTCTFTNRKPDAQIDLSPLTATNAVNSPHTITATVQQDDTYPAGAPGDGATGFGPAPNGTQVTFTLLNNTAGATFVGGVNTCTTAGGTGTCSVQINTSTAGGVDIHATTTFNVLTVSLTRATGTGGLNSADAHKTYVDAQIDVSPLNATNPVGAAHTITATVQQDDGIPAAGGGDGVTGFGPAPNGTLVTFSLLNNTAGATFVGGVSTCTTTAGTCSVQINTNTPGAVDIHATTTFSVGGVSLTRSTGSGGLNSADAHKVYVAGSITIVKDAIPNSALDFNFTSTSDQATTIGSFSLDDDADGTLPNSRTFSNLAPGNYTVTEAGLPIAGWDLTNLVCVGGGANTSTSTATGVATIGLDAGENVTCTYTNTKQTKLKLVKTVTNNNGGTAVPNDWDLTATGSGGFTELTPDGANATFRIVTVGVTYALGETGPSGYAAGAFSCNGGTQVGDSIQLSVGQVVTCTINNDDIPPQLHLRKIVVNDNGGTAVATDWTLTANGTGANDLSGSTPVDSGAGLQADTWALSETGPAGYSTTGYVCVGGTQVGQSITVGIGGSATCTITNDDIPGTIVIVKLTKPVNDPTSFSFDAGGTPSTYNDFSLTGQTGSNTNSQTLNAGDYSVQEINIPADWVLTGIGDPNNGSNCILTTTGSGTSTGTGDVNTQTATIHLGIGDTLQCTFENTGTLVTRTQGFWATHTGLANIAWFGGTAFGHTFPGVANTPGIGDTLLCGVPIDTLPKLMGGFWADISKKCDGKKRTQLDTARMQLLQQLLAAELNASAFGSVPSGGSGKFAEWEAAFCTGTLSQVRTALSEAAAFNTSGDSGVFTPGTSADAKNARRIANTCFWDNPTSPSGGSSIFTKFGLATTTTSSGTITKSGSTTLDTPGSLFLIQTVGPAFPEDKEDKDKKDKPDKDQ
jgi:hypothetical protein